ncbi:MAG: flagellar biosynthesis regulator FlaF [Gammaproteobacteria bacterium]
MQKSAANAYNTVSKASMSPRQLEASILNRAAAMLKAVQDRWDATDRNQKLDEALKYNQKLWSVFQADLASDDNPLPKKLREDILSLSLFVDQRTFDLMANPELEKVSVLININQNIAAGLNTTPANAQPELESA